MLMTAGMALEQCQYDHSADDEPRRGSLLSEFDSDMEDAVESTPTTEPNERLQIDRDSGESRAAPHRPPRLGELIRDSVMESSQLEFFDAPDHFLEPIDYGGPGAPIMESNSSITPVNTMSVNGSNNCDCTPVERCESEDESPNLEHCKEFINNPHSALLSSVPDSTGEINEQLYSNTESGNDDQPHSTTESEGRHNPTDPTEGSDQAHTDSHPENNRDQLHRTTESIETRQQVQTVMVLETGHQPHHTTDSADSSERPNHTEDCEDVCVHSIGASKQISDHISSIAKCANASDQTSNATLSEGIVDRHTEAKDVNDQVDTNGEPDLTCDQQVDLTQSERTTNQCNITAESETINTSVRIMASEEIQYQPQNSTEWENIIDDPHSAMRGKEDCLQLDNNREFEAIGRQMRSNAESQETSQQFTEQINTAGEVSGQINSTRNCKEVIDQPHNITKSEEVSVELCNTTNCDATKNLTQITAEFQQIIDYVAESEDFHDRSLRIAESEGISGQMQNQSNGIYQLHNIVELEASERLHNTTKYADIVDQSHRATEAAETVDQSSNSPCSENSSNQTCKAKGSKEDCDRMQDSMEVMDHINTTHLSAVSAEHSHQQNSTSSPIDRASDLSTTVKNKDSKEVPDKCELGEFIRGPPSNMQSSKIEAVCQSDGFTTQAFNDQIENVNMESCAIPQTCLNSREDIGHERRAPIASDVIPPLDLVFTDVDVVNEDDAEPCHNELAIQPSEDQVPVDDISHEPNVSDPSETLKRSRQSEASLETNDGSSSDSVLPEAHGELHNATEPAGLCQSIATDQDCALIIGVESFVEDATGPFLEATDLLDALDLSCFDAEELERDEPGVESDEDVAFYKDPNINLIHDGLAGTDMHENRPAEDVDVQEIREMLSKLNLLTPSTADHPGGSDSRERDSRISVEESELAVRHPSISHESLDACPRSLVFYKQSVDEDQTEQSGGVELETVVQRVDQTQNPGPLPQIPTATFSPAWIGQKSTHCETTEEVAEIQESITEEHGSQNKHQMLTSKDSEPHSESLTTLNFDGGLQPDSELVPADGVAPNQEVHNQKSHPPSEVKNDDLAWNVSDGQHGDHHRRNSELEPKLHRPVQHTSSTEGQQTPFYIAEDWKEAFQPPNQRVYFRLKQEVGIDRSLSMDSKEKFPLAPETNSKPGQLIVEPPCQEGREDAHETDGVAVGVNPVKVNTEFMKFLSHVPKFFGEAVAELGELPSGFSNSINELAGEACRTSDVNSSTSVGHGNRHDVLDCNVNTEGINIPMINKQTTPIHFFNPLVELSLEEPEAFFKSDIVADLQDDSTIFVSPETLPLNTFDTSLPSQTASVDASDVCSNNKPESSSLLAVDIFPIPDYSPNTENVFHSPQPSPVTVIAGTAETEPEGRSSWMPTWKVPDDSVMQLLSKKLLSPKLARSGSKIYKTTGGVAGLNKESQNRLSTPVLVSHSQLAESREPGRPPTKIPKSFHVALAPTQSKAMFRHVALPEVSEEGPHRDHEEPHQVGEIKSGRLRVRNAFKQRSSCSTVSRDPNRPTVKSFISKGGFSKAKPYTSPVTTQNESKRTPGNLAMADSRSREDLASATAKLQAWHSKGMRKTIMAASQEDDPRDEDLDFTSSDPVLLRDKNFANQTGNIMRRRSKLIDSSRLLYQEYSDVALNQAIERQKRTETFLEESEPSSPRLRRKLMSSPDSYLQRLSVSSSASLWQDIPMIRGTSALLSMTREEQKLQEAKFELIMSEASYLRSLNIAVDHFQHSPELQTLLSNQERQWLFSRLQEVRDVSSEFLFDLEEKFEDNMYTFNVCDVVLSHAPAIRKVYLPYVTNQSYQDQTFRQLLSGNPRFQLVLGKLESDPVCQRLSLKSFLILPFQRITRLKLLVQNILKRTRPGSREEAQATQACNLMEKLIKECNENVQRMRSTEELIYLSQKIEFECKIFPLISQSRRLVKQGELIELEYGSPLSFKWKVITRPLYLHLFNDCLLLSRRREGSRFVVFDHARASKVRGEKCEIKLHGTNKNIFRLTLQENNQGRRVEFLLRTDTQSEKLRWISALAPPRKKPDLMECHDNPQVQCLKSYKARENDELSLEKADIIMVTQQSKEGWIEGIRLSDGEHGWFPVENVEDISNRHVRLRNLKEEHRVQCARAKLTPLSHR